MEIKVDNKSIETLVLAQIKQGVIDALADKSDILIRHIVDDAMMQKKNNYDRQTIIDSLIRSMILQAAKDAISQWVEEHRPSIKRQVEERLSSQKEGLIAKITDGLVANMKLDPVVDVSFRARE